MISTDFYVYILRIGGLRLCMGGVCCVSVSVCVVSECQCYECALSTYGLREFVQFLLSPRRLIVHMVAPGLRYLHNAYNISIDIMRMPQS